ncbi:hypothetical protein ISS22_17685 [candidate division KSB1 bacterium]|nr:hypothetical protein [candidate division KSB1 bacterium]
MKILLIVLIFCCCFQPNKNTLIHLIKNELQTKPNFSIQDAYKLIYQGNFGVAHILKNKDHARQFLKNEIDSIEKSDNEPLIEHISISTNLVRINLRPFKKSGSSIDTLFEIMTRSVEETKQDKKRFLKQWREFRMAVIQEKLKFDVQELETFDLKVKAENYPAVHHSPGYRKANKPAYRVVKESIFREYFPFLK